MDQHEWYAVWGGGFGNEAGILGTYTTEREAKDRADEFNRDNDNPACGAWVRPRQDNE